MVGQFKVLYLVGRGLTSPTGPSLHLNPRALYMGLMVRMT